MGESVFEILAPIVIMTLLLMLGLYFGCKYLDEGSNFEK
jgi:hypothetical protein